MRNAMRNARQHFFCFTAILALTTTSISAFGQSNDYRRGYDDGYAAAQHAMHDGHGRPGPGWNGIRIEEAEYGARGAICDARPMVQNQVEQNGGNVLASNQLCGDPARGQGKHLRIVYRCGDSEPIRVIASENEMLRLSCRR